MAHSFEPILDWSPYFDSKRTVVVPGDNSQDQDSAINFTVYEVHGSKDAPLFIMHHGAGHGALSFGQLTKELKKLLGKNNVNILAYDCRGHGATTSGKSVKKFDSRQETLAKDMGNLVETIYPNKQGLPEKVILVGHSMGGIATVEAAYRPTVPNVAGVVLLDVSQNNSRIPSSAVIAGVSRRPLSFNSLEEAIEFGHKSGDVLNIESLRLSYPPLLQHSPTPDAPSRHVWVTDLLEIVQSWNGWFTNMTSNFLAPKIPKLLVLAGTDGLLDDELRAAIKDGQLNFLLMPNASHGVQEDEPKLLAIEIVAMLKSGLREMREVCTCTPENIH
ncbi:Protein phosphatase methylesterase 1 [Podila humilis]|nr:Protein phosphatase methylesterase 1 [Podila humilis]